MDFELALRAVANERRLRILEWLKNPADNFPPQLCGDLLKDGVCGLLIARKMKVSQPTASEHLKLLTQAGLVSAKRVRQWTLYKREEKGIRELRKLLSTRL